MKMGNFGIVRLRRSAHCTPRVWWPLLGLLVCAAAGCGKAAETPGMVPGGTAAASAHREYDGERGDEMGATREHDTIIPKDAKGVKTTTVRPAPFRNICKFREALRRTRPGWSTFLRRPEGACWK